MMETIKMKRPESIQKRDLQRRDAHDKIDFIFNEIERMKHTGDVQLRFDVNQGGIRSSSLIFGFKDFLSITALPGEKLTPN